MTICPALAREPRALTEIDHNQPLSSLLKITTVQAHAKVKKSTNAEALTSGQLPLDAYIKYLFMLYHIYSALEAALDQHASYPSLSPTYNTRLLARSEALSADIATLLRTSPVPTSWQAHRSYQSFLPFPPTLTSYLNRISDIASSSDPTPLLAHSYVRYIGDLSGGQSIKRAITKAYNLDDSATNFYEFGKLGSSALATNMGDMKKIKVWFSNGIDTGVPDNPAVKAKVVEEAKHVFELNHTLFEALEMPLSACPALSQFIPQPSGRCLGVKAILPSLRSIFALGFLVVALTLAYFFVNRSGIFQASVPAAKARILGLLGSETTA